MLKRIIEIILGLLIGFSLFISYSNVTHESRLAIWYLLTPKVLQIMAWVGLFLLAARLIYGRPKDYSKFFYNILSKFFGDPNKTNK